MFLSQNRGALHHVLGTFCYLCVRVGHRLRVADREGFEPSIRLHVYTRSRRAPSTTRPPVLLNQGLRCRGNAAVRRIYTDEFVGINRNFEGKCHDMAKPVSIASKLAGSYGSIRNGRNFLQQE